MPGNLENPAVVKGLEKVSFLPASKKDNDKDCLNYCKISHVSSKSFKPYFQMYRLDLEKAEDSETKLPTSVGSYKKQENSRKNIYFCFIDYTQAFDCVDATVKNS